MLGPESGQHTSSPTSCLSESLLGTHNSEYVSFLVAQSTVTDRNTKECGEQGQTSPHLPSQKQSLKMEHHHATHSDTGSQLHSVPTLRRKVRER